MDADVLSEKAKKLKHVKVYNRLYSMIQDGVYPPGSQLPSEPELAQQMDVSRMTLRRALALLQEDGLVINIRGKGNFINEADPDAVYEEEYTIDLSQLKPTVAFPHLPENTKTIDEISEDVKIDQSVIGSCTNGRMDDLRAAAEILKGRRVKKGVRCIVIPATQAIYLQAMEEGLLKIFIEAGAVVSTPTCGPCLGGYMGILAAGERCISTTNRNFVGRMGHVDSEVYLASPAVAAASAVTGKISSPEELEA